MFTVGRRASELDDDERDDVVGDIGKRMDGVTEDSKRAG
jgi:hypothetical protein